MDCALSAFQLGPVSLLGDAPRQDRHDDRDGHQRDERHAAGGHREPVPPHELAERVEGAGRPRGDRLVLEVPLEIPGEAAGRLVSAGPILLDGLEHDPVEIAFELLPETRDCRLALLRRRRRLLRCERREPVARRGVVLLAVARTAR